jgi:hypothetical protein
MGNGSAKHAENACHFLGPMIAPIRESLTESRGFKPVGLTVYIFLSLFCLLCLLIWSFRVSFCTHEGTSPNRCLAQCAD